jgi:group I intron endonuclease
MDKTKQLIIGVYKISNIVSGRYYIGYSTNINKRFTVHRSKLKQNCHDNIFLQRAYNLDGEDNFKYDIIHICDTEDEAKEIELTYLADLSIRNIIYNLNYNNGGGDLLTNHPDKEAIRAKILKSQNETLSKMTSEERSKKYGKLGERNGMYGKTHTEEVRKKISEINKGRICPNKGKKTSEETKQKLSENAKLRIGEKNPFFGKHHTEETIQKIREKNIGNIPHNNKEITIDGVFYISMTEASRQLIIPVPTILWRLNSKNPKFDSYKYATMQPSEILSVDDAGNC